jgi:hypothetical protein
MILSLLSHGRRRHRGKHLNRLRGEWALIGVDVAVTGDTSGGWYG